MISDTSDFPSSFSLFDQSACLLDWNRGFEQEFRDARHLLQRGVHVERILGACLLPARALDLSWLGQDLPPSPLSYLNHRRSILITQEITEAGCVLRCARSSGKIHSESSVMVESAIKLLRTSALQMSASILSRRTQEEDGLRAARAEIELANQKLCSIIKLNETIILNSPMPMGVYAADGQCVEANEAYAKLVGASRADLLAQNFRSNEVWRKSGLLKNCLIALEQNTPCECEVATTTSFGLDIVTVCHISPTQFNGEMYLLIQIHDLTERKKIEEELRQMAFHDTLTRLPNRRLLMDRLQQALIRARRNNKRVAMVFLDVNKFKRLNDCHGHEAGDLLLIEVAQRLRETVRERDTVARLGGDEFVLLLEDLHAESDQVDTYLTSIVAKIREVLNQDYLLGDLHYQSSVSIGAKLIDEAEDNLEHIIRAADIAMYEDKRRQLG